LISPSTITIASWSRAETETIARSKFSTPPDGKEIYFINPGALHLITALKNSLLP